VLAKELKPMNGKTTAKGSTIILTILVVVLITLLGLLCYSYSMTMSSKDTEIAGLQIQVNTLNNTLSWYRSKYSSYKYAYESLQQDYGRLKTEYDDLKAKHDELQSIIESGKAIAESATWLSEDKRLKVKSEVIPETLFGKLWHYIVSVNVTNVGEEPLSKVWIFLFPYKGDKLIEDWNPLSYSKCIENLYMGESYSYNFTWVPKDMTTYKIIALAG
jgi:hypothetical protein